MEEYKIALMINKLVHDNCKDVPHDIGIRILDIVKQNLEIENNPVQDYNGIQEKINRRIISLQNSLEEIKSRKIHNPDLFSDSEVTCLHQKLSLLESLKK